MDSSSEDEGDYRTTNVTLGYASVESTGDDISHVGGRSTWLDGNSTPSAAIIKCKSCNGLTSLLLQLNADLQTHFPHDDRRLHIYCCRQKACSRKIGSIRAFREVRKPLAKSKPALNVSNVENDKRSLNLGTTLFGASGPDPNTRISNPFSNSEANREPLPNPFSSLSSTQSLAAIPPQPPADNPQPPIESFAEKLNISLAAQETAQEPWPSNESFPSPFPSYHLDADAEELEPENSARDDKTANTKQYDADESGAEASGKDAFEDTMDKTFQKFSDRVAQNPEQVLRYEFKGQPLLYSGTDDVSTRFIVPHGKVGAIRGIPRCETCGAQRVFELQLVPGLIYELEKDEDISVDKGMEWGTIILGTCTNNCGQPGDITFREEWVGVQWEERLKNK